MPGKASQIDVEVVREAAALLGLPSAASLAAVQAQVAALQTTVEELQALAPFAWVVFDGTFPAGPARIDSSGPVILTRLAPGQYRYAFSPDFGSTGYGAVFGAVGSGVQELARTSTSIDIETPAGEVGTVITVALFGVPA